MARSDKIAIIGNNGWAAQTIIKSLAEQPFAKPLRILAREKSSIQNLPDNVEVVRYSWNSNESIALALRGVDILISFIGHEGLTDQAKLVPFMREEKIKLFVPSDLALPYTPEEREFVTVPREKEKLEVELKNAGVPRVTIVIGNFTSFALDSPYMGIDLANNRILHTGDSRSNEIWLCTRNYVAAGYASIFVEADPSSLAGRVIGLNELHPTTGEIEKTMQKKVGAPPQVAFDSVQNAAKLAQSDRLDALVRKKMGDGSHNVGKDIWEVKGYQKKTLDDLLLRDGLEATKYIQADEQTRHFLDEYFA